jgi:response regulator NasT
MTTLRIAVADDERDMRDYLAKALPRLGYSVVAVADNGRQLVEMCEREQPDLVLTDIRMPELDGIDATEEICRRQEVPVVLISAHHDENRLSPAETRHVLGYLVKPVKMNDLKDAIDSVTRRFQFYREVCAEATSADAVLDDRRAVEDAKTRLIIDRQLNETQAMQALRDYASVAGSRLVEAARTVLAQGT